MEKLLIAIQSRMVKDQRFRIGIPCYHRCCYASLGFITDFFQDHNTDAATLKYPVIETAVQDSLKGFVMFFLFVVYYYFSKQNCPD